MRLADPLPIKFKPRTKKWLMQQAKGREDRSVSGFVREKIEELEARAALNPAEAK